MYKISSQIPEGTKMTDRPPRGEFGCRNEDNPGLFVCTRKAGHSGRHEAGVGSRVVAMWSNEKDDHYVEYPEGERPKFENGRGVHGDMCYVAHESPNGAERGNGKKAWVCSRKRGHTGRHEAASAWGHLIAHWDNDEVSADDDFWGELGL